MRPGARARFHFVFGAAEFLNLKSVPVFSAFYLRRRALGFKLQTREAEIYGRRQFELHVEPAERVETQQPIGNLIIAGVLNRVTQLPDHALRQGDVASRPAAYASQPAFDMNLFAGAIDCAIIEDVPAQLVRRRSLCPTLAFTPPARVFGQQRRIAAVARDQHFPPALGRQRDLGYSIRAGLSRRAGDGLAAGGFFQQFEPGAGDRFAVFERSRPAQQLRLIGESVQPYLTGLNPGWNELRAVSRRYVRRRLDDQ